MLPLDIIRKYYPNASEDELKEIQKIVYCWLAQLCNIFTGRGGWEVLKNQSKR